MTAKRLDVFVHHLIDRLGRLRFLGCFVCRACAAMTTASWLAGGRSGWRASRPTATRRRLLRRASGLRRRHLERQWRRAFGRRASMVTSRAPHALAALERAGVDVVHHAHHVARGFFRLLLVLVEAPLRTDDVAMITAHAERGRNELHGGTKLLGRQILEDLDVLEVFGGGFAWLGRTRRGTLRRARRGLRCAGGRRRWCLLRSNGHAHE